MPKARAPSIRSSTAASTGTRASGYWLIARLVDRFPALPEAPAIHALIDSHFTHANVVAKVAYLQRPEARGFERPYGWTWLLSLAGQLHSMQSGEGQRWSSMALAPLAYAFVERFTEYLPKLTYPLRVGTHFNTAFALTGYRLCAASG